MAFGHTFVHATCSGHNAIFRRFHWKMIKYWFQNQSLLLQSRFIRTSKDSHNLTYNERIWDSRTDSENRRHQTPSGGGSKRFKASYDILMNRLGFAAYVFWESFTPIDIGTILNLISYMFDRFWIPFHRYSIDVDTHFKQNSIFWGCFCFFMFVVPSLPCFWYHCSCSSMNSWHIDPETFQANDLLAYLIQ